MSAAELKLRIINKIASIEDEMILEEIFKLVESESRIDSVYRLNEAERTAVGIGLKDINEGRVYSSEAADSLIKEWLRK